MKPMPFGWLTSILLTLLTCCSAAVTRAEEPAIPDSPETQQRPTLSLKEAIDAALRYSPELASLHAEELAGDARVQQAGLWPNPEVGLTLEHFGGSGDYEGFNQAETTLAVAQPIELGGEPAQRRRVAVLGRRRLDDQVEVRRLAIIADVHKRFLKSLLAQERRDLSAEMESLSADALRTVEGRVRTGAAAATESGQGRIHLGRARMELQRADREIIATRRQLAAMWGETEPSFTTVGNLEDIVPPPPLPDLLARLERNPELTRWDIEVERRTANVNLERAKRIPEVTVAAGARHYSDNDDFAAVVDFSVPLPLFDRNQGGVAEAEQLLVKARADRDIARLQVRSELLAAYDELQTQFERISILGVEVLADAKAARTEILAAYRRGTTHSIDVLAAQRVLVELQGEYFQALADYHTALVEVERLTAMPMSEGTVQ